MGNKYLLTCSVILKRNRFDIYCCSILSQIIDYKCRGRCLGPKRAGRSMRIWALAKEEPFITYRPWEPGALVLEPRTQQLFPAARPNVVTPET